MTGSLAVRGEVWLRAVWECASDAMALSDAEGLVLDANPAYYTLYGLTPEEVLGKSFAVIFPDDQRDAVQAQYRAVFRGTEWSPAYRAVVRRRDGSERIVEARASFLDTDGRRVAMLSIVRDVTETERARQAAAQTERERRAFLSSVSHDLKNPLAAIRGHAQLLRRDIARHGVAPPVDKLLAGLGQIEASALRVVRLVDELAEAATQAAGDVPALQLGPVDMVTLAREAVARYQRLADYHPVILEVGAETLPVRCDAPRLERVLDNLLANAIKYSPGGGTIAVRVVPGRQPGPPACAAENVGNVGNGESTANAASAGNTGEGNDGGPDGVLISVQDQGIGIASADLPHVFERFRRGGNVGTLQGTGIGLTSVRHIVEQHGGAVAIASREGEGTIVSVWLPLGPPAADQRTINQSRQASQEGAGL